MRTRENGTSSDEAKASPPARRADVASAAPVADPRAPMALRAVQRGAGNAAAVQMLRRAGHPGVQAPVQRSTVPGVLGSAGRSLDEATRTDMESRLGADFSDVRVHDDAAARRSAAEIGARAYTSGNHVVIGDGGGDRHTLAHELTHVIQQRQGPVAGTDHGDGLRVSDPTDRFEREAERNAHRALSGRGTATSAAKPGTEAVSTQRSVREGTVQRVGTPENVQDVWTNRHWEQEAGDRPAVNPNPPGGGRTLTVILRDVANQLLTELAAQGERAGQKELRVFRTMTNEEADAILEWRGAGKKEGTEAWLRENRGAPAGITERYHAAKAQPGSAVGAMPVKKHLGDWDQAYDYYERNHAQHYATAPRAANGRVVGGPEVRVLEFTLKKGAHELLFSPDYMALAGNTGAPAALRKIYGEQNRQFATASGNEGSLTGYVGMKLEDIGDFSLSVGSNAEATQLLFQLFVQDIQDVTKRASHRWNAETEAY
ncbi:eCIS core domain-containing protein [Streptomyces sp. YIM S03343]